MSLARCSKKGTPHEPHPIRLYFASLGGLVRTRCPGEPEAAEQEEALMTAPLRWERREGGYMSADGAFYLLRGALMTHGCNAWLIHQRVNEEEIGREAGVAFARADGSPLWSIDSEGYASTEGSDFSGPLYRHAADAGWLSEAKAVVTKLAAEAAA